MEPQTNLYQYIEKLFIQTEKPQGSNGLFLGELNRPVLDKMLKDYTYKDIPESDLEGRYKAAYDWFEKLSQTARIEQPNSVSPNQIKDSITPKHLSQLEEELGVSLYVACYGSLAMIHKAADIAFR
jgi:hypothetical protein